MYKKIFVFLFVFILGIIPVGASDNPFVDLTTDMSTHGIEATTQIMASPVGSILYFQIGAMMLMMLVGMIISIIYFKKK